MLIESSRFSSRGPDGACAWYTLRWHTGIVLALAVLSGCDTSPRKAPVVTQQAASRIETSTSESADPPVARPIAGPELPPAATPAANEPPEFQPIQEPDDGGKLVYETWDAYSLQGHRIGYAHTSVANIE